jgi:hypothetical protein
MIETPHAGSATINREGSSLEITIPTNKNWFNIIFLGAWLGGWYVGEMSAIGHVVDDNIALLDSWFLIFWLIGWTIGGIAVILILLWIVGGKETVNVDDGEITIGKEIFGLGNYKTYKISTIKYLALARRLDRDRWGQSMDRYLLKNGLIEFDYGLRTIRFASGVDVAEARHLIEVLKGNANFKESNFN